MVGRLSNLDQIDAVRDTEKVRNVKQLQQRLAYLLDALVRHLATAALAASAHPRDAARAGGRAKGRGGGECGKKCPGCP